MRILPFDSIHAALVWFFNESWLKGPADARAIPLIKVSGSYKHEDPEEITQALLTIRAALDNLTARNFCILRAHYHRRGATQAEVALSFNLAGGPRSIRRLKAQLIAIIEERFIETGIIKIPKPGEIKYVNDEGEDLRDLG